MSYKDLQDKAKDLGLKYNGVSKKDLEKSIEKAENKATSKESSDKEDSKSSKVEPKNANVAVILDKKREVRRYTLDLHGEDFTKLAKTFAEDNKYDVKLEEVGPSIECPSCGHKFDTKQ